MKTPIIKNNAAVDPPGRAVTHALVPDVHIAHVELVVHGHIARGVAAGDEVNVELGYRAFPAVVRQVESSISHIGGDPQYRLALWIDSPIGESGSFESGEAAIRTETPFIRGGELKEVSISFIDQDSPVPEYEPNGTPIDGFTIGDYFHGGDCGGRLTIGGEVFNAVHGDFGGSCSLSDADDPDPQTLVDVSFKIDGIIDNPIKGVDSKTDDCELVIPLYPGFADLEAGVDPIKVDESTLAGAGS